MSIMHLRDATGSNIVALTSEIHANNQGRACQSRRLHLLPEAKRSPGIDEVQT